MPEGYSGKELSTPRQMSKWDKGRGGTPAHLLLPLPTLTASQGVADTWRRMQGNGEGAAELGDPGRMGVSQNGDSRLLLCVCPATDALTFASTSAF